MDVYIGAYLEIKAPKIERPGPKECPDGHQAANHWNVCPFCGGPLARRPLMYTVGLSDMLGDREDLRELDFGSGKILAAGNLVDTLLPDHIKVINASFDIKLDPAMIDVYMLNFKTNYGDVIDLLAEKAKVAVKFGVVGYD